MQGRTTMWEGYIQSPKMNNPPTCAKAARKHPTRSAAADASWGTGGGVGHRFGARRPGWIRARASNGGPERSVQAGVPRLLLESLRPQPAAGGGSFGAKKTKFVRVGTGAGGCSGNGLQTSYPRLDKNQNMYDQRRKRTFA